MDIKLTINESHGANLAISSARLNKSSIFLRRAKSVLLNLRNVRRVGVEMQPILAKIDDPNSRKLFGNVNIGDLLYKSYNSLAIVTDDSAVSGVICFDHYPNVLSIPAWSWTEWLNNLYGLKGMTTDNTNWIHYMASEKRYVFTYAKTILQYLFLECRKLKYVLLLVPPGVNAIDYLDDIGTLILPLTQDFFTPKKVQKIYLFMRQNFILNYKMRRAVEEDNDDLVPLIHSHSDLFQKLYGEYYIAEILTAHEGCGRQIIVSEYGGKACGVVILNETLNYDLLRNDFEITPYNGLKKVTLSENFLESGGSEIMIGGTIYYDEETESRSTFGSAFSIISSVESDESLLDLEEEEESEDDFSIVNVSSTALLAVIGSSQGDFFEEDDVSENSLYNQFIEFAGLFDKNFKKDPVADELKSHIDIQTYLALVPTYYGMENAFALEVCCTANEHENAISLLLESAFECFSDREYLVLSSPPTHQCHAVTKHLVKVPQRPIATFPQELYILHRSAMAGEVRVHGCTMEDMRAIIQFLDKQSRREEIYKHVQDALRNSESRLYVYAMECEDIIVGLAIIDEAADADFYAIHYEFSPYVNLKFHKSGSYGKILSIVLTPVFKTHAPFFMRELHRLSDFSLLFYTLTSKDTSDKKKGSLPVCNILHYLIPLKPRRLPSYDERFLKDCMPSEKILKEIDLFALYISTSRMSSIDRIEVNNKIVVVGASTAGVAFLETLILTQTTNYVVVFTNVTIVSPLGIPYNKPVRKPRNMFFVENNSYNHKYLEQYPLRSYVNTVYGNVNAIDRKHKFVTIDGKYVVPYDYLFLMCGEQFHSPIKQVNYNGEVKAIRKKPDNVIIINNTNDVIQAITKIKTIHNISEKERIIVYGHYLEAYCCVAALLEMGIAGKNIVFLDPYPNMVTTEGAREDEITSVFNDGEIEDAIMDIIAAEGVTVYESYVFRDCTVNDKNVVTSAVFESKHRMLVLNCSVIIFYSSKIISHRTFMSIAMSGLVFDGQLVIDNECRTNDEFIYGCGPLTKYSSRYYDLNGMHRYFDQKEVGSTLALQIRKKLIPAQYVDEEPQSEPDLLDYERGKHLLPRYEEPIVKYCMLPGKLYYLSITKPGKPVPLEAAMSKDNYEEKKMMEEEETKKKRNKRIIIHRNIVLDPMEEEEDTKKDDNNEVLMVECFRLEELEKKEKAKQEMKKKEKKEKERREELERLRKQRKIEEEEKTKKLEKTRNFLKHKAMIINLANELKNENISNLIKGILIRDIIDNANKMCI